MLAALKKYIYKKTNCNGKPNVSNLNSNQQTLGLEVQEHFQLETLTQIDETQQDQIQSISADSAPVPPILDQDDSAAWQPVTEEPVPIYVKEEQPSNNVYFNIS